MNPGTLLNVATLRSSPVPAGGATNGSPQNVGVFVTPQSLATFPGAVAVISFLWQILARFWPALAAHWTALWLSFLIGGLIYWMSATDGQSSKEKAVSFAIAVINCFALAAAVLGVHSAAGSTPAVP